MLRLSLKIGIVLFTAVFAGPVSAEGAPKIVVENATVEFDTVSQGVPVQHAFEIKNAGNKELTITHIQPDCGCTVAQPEKLSLAPEESMNVNVVFNTAGFYGYKVKTVHIYSNDPKRRSVPLSLQGKVRRAVEVEPARVFFGPVRGGSAPSKTLTVIADNDAVQITDIISQSELLKVSSQDITVAGKRGKKFVVQLSDTTPLGQFRSGIVVKTSSEQTPVINVPVFARVEGDLVLEPADVSFGLLEGPLLKPAVSYVRVNNTGSQPVHIVKAESDNPAVDVQIRHGADKLNYELIVTLNKEATGSLHAKVKLETDHPDEKQRKLVLPVYGIIATKGS